LFHPKTLGATLVFNKIIEPFMLKNASKFEEGFNKIEGVYEENVKKFE
jgi:hypothetical protein